LKTKLKPKSTEVTAIKITPLNTIDVELDWIQRAKENVDFLNANLKYHSILFRVQRSEVVAGDVIN
jgi:DNA-directed RNA polymerase subunit E'/Rpb7